MLRYLKLSQIGIYGLMLVLLSGCGASVDSLVGAYLKTPFLGPVAASSGDIGNDEAWNKAKALYESGDFAGAAAQFESVAWDPYFDGPADFYIGLCKLYQTEPDLNSAIVWLEKAEKKTANLRTHAYWFLTLAYLKTDYDKGVERLYFISESPGHVYTDQASELINALLQL